GATAGGFELALHGRDAGRGRRLAEFGVLASRFHAGGGSGAPGPAAGRSMRSHFLAGSCQRVSMFSTRRASSSGAASVTCFIARTTVLPSLVGCIVQTAS